MSANATLTPARELAHKNTIRFPDETSEYRQARNALLSEEIELRRHIERVAAQRRALPGRPGAGAPQSAGLESRHRRFRCGGLLLRDG